MTFNVPSMGASRAFQAARMEAERAISYVALLLDERVADRRVGEMIRVHTAAGPRNADLTDAIRSFDGNAELRYPTSEALDSLRTANITRDAPAAGALSLYLHAIEKRYSQEGFVLLSAAVDDLAGAGSFKPHQIQKALVDAGRQWDIGSLRKISTARGYIVHHGLPDQPETYQLWYDLEEIARILLRHASELNGGWPARVPMYEGHAWFLDCQESDSDEVIATIPSWEFLQADAFDTEGTAPQQAPSWFARLNGRLVDRLRGRSGAGRDSTARNESHADSYE